MLAKCQQCELTLVDLACEWKKALQKLFILHFKVQFKMNLLKHKKCLLPEMTFLMKVEIDLIQVCLHLAISVLHSQCDVSTDFFKEGDLSWFWYCACHWCCAFPWYCTFNEKFSSAILILQGG